MTQHNLCTLKCCPCTSPLLLQDTLQQLRQFESELRSAPQDVSWVVQLSVLDA